MIINKFFISSAVINFILTLLLSSFYAKMWFLMLNILIFFTFLVMYILLVKDLDLKNELHKKIKFFLILIFMWSTTNLFFSVLGYTLSFFIRLNKNIVDTNTDNVVHTELIANPSQKAVLYGKINFLTQQGLAVVSDAQVILKDISDSIILDQTYSDAEGKFRLVLNVPQKENFYNLYIYHENYKDYKTKVQLIPGIVHELDLTLMPESDFVK